MGEDEIVKLFNAKIKLERKQYRKRVLQLEPEKIYQRAYQINCRENIAETLLEKSSEMKTKALFDQPLFVPIEGLGKDEEHEREKGMRVVWHPQNSENYKQCKH